MCERPGAAGSLIVERVAGWPVGRLIEVCRRLGVHSLPHRPRQKSIQSLDRERLASISERRSCTRQKITAEPLLEGFAVKAPSERSGHSLSAARRNATS